MVSFQYIYETPLLTSSILFLPDHGLDVLSQWVTQTDFPWLMSNVLDNETGRPLGEGRITHVVHWDGRRIGLLGLVEKEWLDTLATINPEETTFLDFVEAGHKLSAQLKQEVGVNHLFTGTEKLSLYLSLVVLRYVFVYGVFL